MMAETTEQMKMAAQVILAAIVVFAVFTSIAAIFYFHAKKRPFPATHRDSTVEQVRDTPAFLISNESPFLSVTL